MKVSWMDERLTAPQKRVVLWSFGALLLCLAMNAYHYSLEGAKGLYLWNRTGLFRSLILIAFIPGSLALLSFPLEKLKKKSASKIMRGVSLACSLIVALLSIGIFVFLFIGPRSGSVEPPRLTLINPAEGIQQSSLSLTAGGIFSNSSAPLHAQPTGNSTVPASLAPPLLRLSFSSDPHWGADTSNNQARSDILAHIAERKPDAFFMLGDTVETGSKALMWNFALADLEAIIPSVPLRVLLGNHDALFGGQYLYKKAFVQKDFKSDSGSPYYYSIDAGVAKIIVLDLPWGTEQFNTQQKKWLTKTLTESNRTKPVIVLSHSFFYASGYDDPELDKPWYDHFQNIPAITPLFEQYGVDLVISGHNHYQEYLETNGVHYAVIGAMGGIPDPKPKYVSPASKWIAVNQHGWLDVDIYEGELVLSFRDQNNAVLHQEQILY